MIRIRAFRAPQDRETCEKFVYGHRKILEVYYGIIKITSDNTEWMADPLCIVIVAEDIETGKVYGGARVQIASEAVHLPLEQAISKYDPAVYEHIRESRMSGGTCEICGLWNSKEVAGMGIGSRILSMVGIAITEQLNVSSMYVLCAPATVGMAYKMGLVVVTSLGNNGTFYYPKDDFIATVMQLRDIFDLSLAKEREKDQILFLRENTQQTRWERGPKGDFQVLYEIQLDPITV
ncbi:hypothetical protein GCM10027051_04490 [Niabella terrae]